MLEIQLLGSPSLTRDGDPARLSGRKTWGLLAYLLLEARPVSRLEVTNLLSPEADDPQAALRWLLHQVRRATSPELVIDANDDRLVASPGEAVRSDIGLLFADRPDPLGVRALSAGELLEGMSFDDAPGFEMWLTLQRSRVRAALVEMLGWAATRLASDRRADAIAALERALMIDPYSEQHHEMLVDVLIQSGDRAAALAHVESTERRFRSDLGIGLPIDIRRPLLRRQATDAQPTRAAARAQLTTARAHSAAGAYDAAIAASRRAADTALAVGDPRLELQALLLLATTLIHARRGRDPEAIGLLQRSAQLAAELGEEEILSDVDRELGYVLLVQGAYGAAEPLLRQAVALSVSSADNERLGRARTFLGMCLTDQGKLEPALAELREAVRLLSAFDDPGWLGYAQGTLARALIHSGDIARGGEVAEDGMANGRRGGITVMMPWPLLVAADAALQAGDRERAEDLYAEAVEYGRELDDPCWEGLGLRGLAELKAQAGDRPAAAQLLAQGLAACRRYPDVYAWARALILIDLVEIENGNDPDTLAEAHHAVTTFPLPTLANRLQPWMSRAEEEPPRAPDQQTLSPTPSA